MSPSLRKILAFGVAGSITAAAWIHFWPGEKAPVAVAPAAPPTAPKPPVWNKERLGLLVTAVEKAGSDDARLSACADLLQIPAANASDLVEEMVAKDGKRLSLAAKTLLIRWASDDGEAAALWAWNRLRPLGSWSEAFQQIGPSWAAHDPAGLAKWAMEAGKQNTAEDDPGSAKDDSGRKPVLNADLLTHISRWLVTEEPRLAYEIVKARGGMSSEDEKIALALRSVESVRAALTAFGDLKIKDPKRFSGDEIQLYYILRRWSELDPDDFNRSEHGGTIVIQETDTIAAAAERWKQLPAAERVEAANRQMDGVIPAARAGCIRSIAEAWADIDPPATIRWLDSLPPEDRIAANTARISALVPHNLTATLDWMDGLPPEERPSSLVPTFDAWTKAHPGKRADRKGWPAERISVWEDLEALQAE